MGQGHSCPEKAAAYPFFFEEGIGYTHRMKNTMFLFHIPYDTKLWINKTAQGVVNLPTTILASILSMREAGSHFVFLLSWTAPAKKAAACAWS